LSRNVPESLTLLSSTISIISFLVLVIIVLYLTHHLLLILVFLSLLRCYLSA
jgi:hypothetical protein